MRRWLNEYRDAGGSFHAVADEVVATLERRLRDFAALDVFPAAVLTPIHGLAIHRRTELDERTDLVLIRQERDVRHAFDYTFSFPQSGRLAPSCHSRAATASRAWTRRGSRLHQVV